MIVYLIHFERPIGNLDNRRGTAQHYLGCTEDLDSRLKRHRYGYGARIMRAIQAAGVKWQVARTWEGDFTLEAKLKQLKNGRKLCPICSQRGNDHDHR